jgi:hypothetical protein
MLFPLCFEVLHNNNIAAASQIGTAHHHQPEHKARRDEPKISSPLLFGSLSIIVQYAPKGREELVPCAPCSLSTYQMVGLQWAIPCARLVRRIRCRHGSAFGNASMNRRRAMRPRLGSSFEGKIVGRRDWLAQLEGLMTAFRKAAARSVNVI